MGDLILPGAYGIGTERFSCTHEGYAKAADALVHELNSGRNVNLSDPDVRRVMNYFGSDSLETLRIQRRGW